MLPDIKRKDFFSMTYHELVISIAAPFQEQLITSLTEAGCLGVIENSSSIIAYFPETIDIKTIKSQLALFQELLEKAGHAPNLSFVLKEIQDQDWNESWKKSFQPLDVGKRFTILPPWEKKKDNRINLIIDPGMAFGTGHHETTRSCLVLMEKYAEETSKDSFLDLGTGTGLLAIAASKLGYRNILAIDNDPLAVDATRENCKTNGTVDIEIMCGTLADTHNEYDVIAANLISGLLIELAPALFDHVKKNGIAFLSGILAEQKDEVIEAMEKAGFRIQEKYPDGKWVSLVVRK